jgi:predicted permease
MSNPPLNASEQALPDWKPEIRQRLAKLRLEPTRETAIIEELAQHLDDCYAELLAGGMTAAEAERQTRAELSGSELLARELRRVERQVEPDPPVLGTNRRTNMIADLWQDLRYGARMLLKKPGFTLIAIFTLALGICANATIFSAVNAVLFRALPYKEPGRLVQVFQRFYARPTMDTMPVAPANFIDWQTENKSFEALAAFRLANFNLSGGAGPERVRAAQTSANVFAVLGVEPILGRAFQSGEDLSNSEPVVVLSYNLWQRRFGGDTGIIGKTVKANNKQYTVIGVMPLGFRFPIGWLASDVELWAPLVLEAGERNERTAITLEVVARLRPGVKLEEAQANLEVVMRQLAQAYPQTNKGWGANLMPLVNRGVRGYRVLFLFLSLAAGVTLLIACGNVANLLLARGVERQKELTIRTALGAQRARLIRQLLTEGILLSSLGGLIGIVLAIWGIYALAALAPTNHLPELKYVSLNGRVLAFSLGLSALAGLLFSLFPALTLSTFSLTSALQEGGRGASDSPRRNRLKAGLVIGELALTLALLLCMGTLIRTFLSSMAIEPGFMAENVLTLRIALPIEKYKQGQQWAAFFERVEEEVKTIPGVVTAAVGSGAPMEEAGEVFKYHLAGKPEPDSTRPRVMADYFRVSPDYFRAAGIKLRQGRFLSGADIEGAPQVALVNETFVKREFPDKNPIGERITLLGNVNRSVRDEGAPALEIVGVVADTREFNIYQAPPAIIYGPMRQNPQRTMSLLVKSTTEPTSLLPELRRRLLKLDPDQPVYNIRTLEQLVSEKHALFRFNTLLLTVFAALAFVLSLIGVYGVIAYSVSQRTREFGIRLALGAQPKDLFKLVLGKGARLSVIGLGLGIAASFPAIKLLARSLKESMYLDLIGNGPLLFSVICGAMTLVTLFACFIPARRATQVDPLTALRSE